MNYQDQICKDVDEISQFSIDFDGMENCIDAPPREQFWNASRIKSISESALSDPSLWLNDSAQVAAAHNDEDLESEEDHQGNFGSAIDDYGVEVIAFYKSPRFRDSVPFCGKWGIFYIKQGMDYVFNDFKCVVGAVSDKELRKYFFEFIRRHELFHYMFDVSCMPLEKVTKNRLYEALHRAYIGREIFMTEEACANNASYIWMTKSPRAKNINGFIDYACRFMRNQPGAYSNFDHDQKKLLGNLSAELIDRNFSGASPRLDLGPWMGVHPHADFVKARIGRYCPEYFIEASPNFLSSVVPFRVPNVSNVNETPAFFQSLEKHALQKKWLATKNKLITNRLANGLDFKLWDKGNNEWSIRVDRSFRAHLIKPIAGNVWDAIKIGPHKEMGHG